MKTFVPLIVVSLFFSAALHAQSPKSKNAPKKTKDSATKPNSLFLDVHHLGAGKVTAKDVAAAHQKDLAVEKKYGVNIIKYWLDEKNGDVYCLASAPDSESLRATHAEAHGLVPDAIRKVSEGKRAQALKNKNLYLDIHELGPGKVTAKDVAGAHEKDLQVQKKYGVNLITYWVDEKNGTVMCLAEAADSTDLIKTHKEAHGLVPQKVMKVKEGQ